MTDILRLAFTTLLLTITFSAYFLVIGALFPNRVAKTQVIINQTTARSFGLGMVNFLFFGTIVLVLLFLMDGRVPEFLRILLIAPTLAITGLLIVLATIGLTSMVKILGERIFPDFSLLKQTLWASVVLSLACSLPFVGWFLLLPYVAFVGIGATILGFFQKS